MIIILDGKEYAVGLNWFSITSTDEVSQFQKEMELTHGVLKFNKNPDLPSTVALAGSEYEGQVSLAGILSYAYSNLLYVAKTGTKNEAGDTLYYLCTVKHGAVSVEGDVIADLETIQALYAANLAELTAEMDVSEINRLGTDVDAEEFEGVALLDFHAVLESAQRYASQCTIKILAKAGLSKPAAVMIVVLFALTGYLGYAWLSKEPPPPPVAVVEPRPEPAPRPILERRDPFEVFMEQFVYRLSETPEPEIVPELIAKIKQLPLSYGGWTLNSINFYGADTESLGLTFTRQEYSNVNALLQYAEMGYFTEISMGQEGNAATAVYPMTLENIPYIKLAAIKNLRADVQIEYFNMVSALQSYDLDFSPGEAEWNNYFAGDNFSMSGTGLWALERVAGILSQFDTLGISTVGITIENGNYNWTLEGIIYG